MFLDLSSAFASVVRELAFTKRRTPEAAAYIMAKFKIPGDALKDVHDILNQPDALDRLGTPGHLKAMLEQSHTATWFTTQGLSEPAGSEAGSKAGDLLGGVIFIA